MSDSKQQFTSRQIFFNLFFFVVLIIHFWSYYVLLKDLEGMYFETDLWSTMGFAAYILLVTLVESILVALLAWGGYYLLPARHKQGKRLGAIKLVTLIVLLYAIGMQFFPVIDKEVGTFYWRAAYHLSRLGWLGLGGVVLGVILSITLPLMAALKFEKISQGINAISERFDLLSGFYVLIDVLGMIVLLARNI